MSKDGCPTTTATEDIFAVSVSLSNPTLKNDFQTHTQKEGAGCSPDYRCSIVVAQRVVATPVSSSLINRASPALVVALCCRSSPHYATVQPHQPARAVAPSRAVAAFGPHRAHTKHTQLRRGSNQRCCTVPPAPTSLVMPAGSRVCLARGAMFHLLHGCVKEKEEGRKDK